MRSKSNASSNQTTEDYSYIEPMSMTLYEENPTKISQKLNLHHSINKLTETNAYYWNKQPKIFPSFGHLDKDKPTTVELFSGLGGTSIGFEMAGFQTVLGVDIHAPSIETFRKSHHTATSILGDITKIVGIDKDNSNNVIMEEVRKKLGNKRPDVLIAGIPCQGFSLANKKRSHLDERNYLFLYFSEMARALKPKNILIENVSGLRTLKGGEFEQNIVDELREVGYEAHAEILNAAQFGVPQIRKRVVFLGCEIGKKITFPKPKMSDGTYLTVRDAIGDLPPLEADESSDKYSKPPQCDFQFLMRGKEAILKNHVAPNHPNDVIEKIRRTKPGEPMYSAYKQRIRLTWSKPSPTQVSGGIRPQFQFGHPQDSRGLSVRERCRIQSIPDNVEIFGGTVQGRVQTGNAVPPLLARAIAEELNGRLMIDDD